MILGMEPKNQVNRATRSEVMAISQFSSERAKMKEFTNVAGSVTSFAGSLNLFCPSWIL